MAIADLEASLRRLIRANGVTLKGIDASTVLRLAIQHWVEVSVDQVRPDAGDGLVAYFEVVNSGRGTAYEFGVSRVLRPQPTDDAEFWKWPTGHRLSLSAAYALSPAFLACKPVTATFDCWSRGSAEQFRASVESSAQFLALAAESPKTGAIRFSECPVPPDEPNHPSKGLGWAIG